MWKNMMEHFRMSSGITLASPSYINTPALIAPHNFLSPAAPFRAARLNWAYWSYWMKVIET